MWKLDLSELNIETSCFDSMIKVILKSFGFEYLLFELKKFSANHLRHDDNKGFYITRGLDHISIWKEIFQLKNKTSPKSEILNFNKYIQAKLKNSPVGIFADAFYCSWTLFYQREHMDHFFLITTYNEYDNTYMCVDIYYPTCGEIRLSFDELDQIYHSIYEFEFGNSSINYLKNAICYLKNHIQIPEEKTYQSEKENMIKFLSGLPYDFTDSDRLDVSPFLLKLKLISEDKINFMHGLQYLEESLQQEIFTSIYPYLEKVSHQFSLLKGILIRFAITKSLNLEKVRVYVENIYELDYQICSGIYNILFNGSLS